MKALRGSLDRKLRLALGTVAVISAAIASVAFSVREVIETRRSLARDVGSVADIVATRSAEPLEVGDRHAVDEVLASLAARDDIVGACVFSRDGTLFARYERDGRSTGLFPPAPPREGAEYRDGLLRVARVVSGTDDVPGTIFVVCRAASLSSTLVPSLATTVLAVAGALAAAGFVLARLRRSVIDPVRDLASAARGIPGGGGDPPDIPEPRDEDLGAVAAGLRQLLESEQSRERDVRFEAERMEEKLAERSSDLRILAQALEQSPAMVMITEIDGTIRFVNREFAKVTGFDREQLLGKDPRFLKDGDQGPGFFRRIWDVLLSGREWRGEYRNRRRDGASFWEWASISPVCLDDGTVRGLVAVKEDITERKSAERQVREAWKAAEAASKAKSAFLANMSHEIRTPMNGILGMAELALETRLDEEQREYIGMLKASAVSLLSIINDILDVSKIEAGKLELESVPFDLRNIMSQLVKTFAFRAREKDLELVCSVPSDVPCMLVGDPGRLRQILVNLLGNAVKFTERGEILVEAALDGIEGDEAVLRFSVTDTGIGVDEDLKRRIFEAFSQATTSISRRFGGTGLGLSISSLLVRMMKGEIWVESPPAGGSRFCFTTRHRLQEGLSSRDPAPELSSLAGLRVLVVDDNRTNLRVLGEIFRGWRMAATCVDNGRQALEEFTGAAESDPYRMVVVDLDMPGMSGLQLIESLAGMPALDEAAVLVLTSGEHGEEIRKCRELGIHCGLRKPVLSTELLEAVKRCLGIAAASRPGSKRAAARTASRRDKRPRTLRVLLTEDNDVNRRLAVRLLEKQGHSVVAVRNGLEALEALSREVFDVIIMDVQMPDMDGFEATEAIREIEKVTGDHVPIIALTAKALKGDRERCLEAGMDGYLAKPVSADGLREAIEQATAAGSGSAGAEPGPDDSDAIDGEKLLERFGRDRELLVEAADGFLAGYPELIADIRQGIESGDLKKAAESAHSLKGAASHFATGALLTALLGLELAAKKGAADEARTALDEAETRLGGLRTLLEEVRAKHTEVA